MFDSDDNNTLPIPINQESNGEATAPIPLKSENQVESQIETPQPSASSVEKFSTDQPPAESPEIEPMIDAGAKQLKQKRLLGLWIPIGLFLVLLVSAAGGYWGYQTGIQDRLTAQGDQIAILTTEQFQLGLVDMQSERYEVARQRFEYVIQLDPNFPGAIEKLTECMLALAQEKTPTPVLPTATIEPSATPDLRPVEDLFTQAMQYLRSKDWKATISTIEALRDADLTYRAVDVDGMYYIALRGRGIDKILLEGNLEGGIYDLSLVERFGPLDRDANNNREMARAYINGAAFWGVDWQKVVYFFSQVYPGLPNLKDASGWTATERYRVALIKYGDQLMAAEDFCGARDQYQAALLLAADNKLVPTATAAQYFCAPPTPTPTITPIASPTSEIFPTVEIATTEPVLPPVDTPAGQ
jgi:hypothetical protein